MAVGLSKAKKVKTLAQVRAEFLRSGKSVRSWATENGFSVNLVYMVLSGQRPGLRGQTHRIAVRLGVKDGIIADA